MLIYVKQLIWETSESSSIKDPATFIFFCLHERDSTPVPMYAHLPMITPLTLRVRVCACIWACVRLCLDSWSWLYLTQPHGSYLSVGSRCDLNDGSAHNYWITILINRFLAAEIMKTRAAQKVNEFLWQCVAKNKCLMKCKYLSMGHNAAIFLKVSMHMISVCLTLSSNDKCPLMSMKILCFSYSIKIHVFFKRTLQCLSLSFSLSINIDIYIESLSDFLY